MGPGQIEWQTAASEELPAETRARWGPGLLTAQHPEIWVIWGNFLNFEVGNAYIFLLNTVKTKAKSSEGRVATCQALDGTFFFELKFIGLTTIRKITLGFRCTIL